MLAALGAGSKAKKRKAKDVGSLQPITWRREGGGHRWGGMGVSSRKDLKINLNHST